MTLQGTNLSRVFGVYLMSRGQPEEIQKQGGNILSSSHLQLPKQLWFLLKKKKNCFPISLRDEQVTGLNRVSQLLSGFCVSSSTISNPSCLILTGGSPVTIKIFGVWDHRLSQPTRSLPSAPPVIAQKIQGFTLLWWAIPKPYAGSKLRPKKAPSLEFCLPSARIRFSLLCV